jgi:hypothetical protein
MERAIFGKMGKPIRLTTLTRTTRLTAAPKPIHRLLPSLTDRTSCEAFCILFYATENVAMANTQAIQEIIAVTIVPRKATISIIRLLQHQAKNAKPSVISENVRAR